MIAHIERHTTGRSRSVRARSPPRPFTVAGAGPRGVSRGASRSRRSCCCRPPVLVRAFSALSSQPERFAVPEGTSLLPLSRFTRVRLSTVSPQARPLPDITEVMPFGPTVRTVDSRSVHVVSHHLDGFLRILRSRACCIPLPVLRFARFSASRDPRDPKVCWPAVACPSGASPLEESPSPAAGPCHHGLLPSCRFLSGQSSTSAPKRDRERGMPLLVRRSRPQDTHPAVHHSAANRPGCSALPLLASAPMKLRSPHRRSDAWTPTSSGPVRPPKRTHHTGRLVFLDSRSRRLRAGFPEEPRTPRQPHLAMRTRHPSPTRYIGKRTSHLPGRDPPHRHPRHVGALPCGEATSSVRWEHASA